MFQVRVQNLKEGRYEAILSGSLDDESAHELKNELKDPDRGVGDDVEKLLLDFTDLEAIGDKGIQEAVQLPFWVKKGMDARLYFCGIHPGLGEKAVKTLPQLDVKVYASREQAAKDGWSAAAGRKEPSGALPQVPWKLSLQRLAANRTAWVAVLALAGAMAALILLISKGPPSKEPSIAWEQAGLKSFTVDHTGHITEINDDSLPSPRKELLILTEHVEDVRMKEPDPLLSLRRHESQAGVWQLAIAGAPQPGSSGSLITIEPLKDNQVSHQPLTAELKFAYKEAEPDGRIGSIPELDGDRIETSVGRNLSWVFWAKGALTFQVDDPAALAHHGLRLTNIKDSENALLEGEPTVPGETRFTLYAFDENKREIAKRPMTLSVAAPITNREKIQSVDARFEKLLERVGDGKIHDAETIRNAKREWDRLKDNPALIYDQIKSVDFPTGKSTLPRHEVDSLIDSLKSNPHLDDRNAVVVILGLADTVGDFDSNYRLSRNRAMHVRDVIQAQVPGKIFSYGLGEVTLYEDDKSNRAVEVWLVVEPN